MKKRQIVLKYLHICEKHTYPLFKYSWLRHNIINEGASKLRPLRFGTMFDLISCLSVTNQKQNLILQEVDSNQ